MQIGFYGAAETVTGSKHLLTLKSGKKILLDVGFFQGRGKDTHAKNKYFDFDPSQINYVILSHAHIDHAGNIPGLVKKGFKGKIYCTEATYDLCEIMLSDSAYIQLADTNYLNKRREREGKKPLEPLYTLDDVKQALKQFETIPYRTLTTIDDEVKLLFTDAGHILGAAVINLTIKEGNKTHRLCYTGDVGRYINKILKHPEPFPQADVIICESTYGDRLHESTHEAREKLMQAVRETCVMNKGKLVIPAFSVGKTQELIYTLDKMEHKGQLPPVKVFVDSPLAINATNIIRKHTECYSNAIKHYMEKDPDPFGFSRLHYVRDPEQSMAINTLQEPCIIISASGMAEAGRIKHHIINTIGDARNAILIIGYSEPSSLAGKLLRGDKEVSIFGSHHQVLANVYNIDFFSAHADQNELLQFLACQNKSRIKRLFLVHGNKTALSEFSDRLYEKGYSNITIPKYKEVYTI